MSTTLSANCFHSFGRWKSAVASWNLTSHETGFANWLNTQQCAFLSAAHRARTNSRPTRRDHRRTVQSSYFASSVLLASPADFRWLYFLTRLLLCTPPPQSPVSVSLNLLFFDTASAYCCCCVRFCSFFTIYHHRHKSLGCRRCWRRQRLRLRRRRIAVKPSMLTGKSYAVGNNSVLVEKIFYACTLLCLFFCFTI